MIGVLGGTSFHETALSGDGSARRVVTPWGAVDVVEYEGMLLVDRHGREAYAPPHTINHHANVDALLRSGAEALISVGSVGSLKQGVAPGAFLLIDDLFMPGKVVTWYHDRIRFTVPHFDVEWLQKVQGALVNAGLAVTVGGVYAETTGPRFETVAEVKWLAAVADVVGMTCASEAVLAMEREVPHALLAVVDNYAHGIGPKPLSGDAFQEQVRNNRERTLVALQSFIAL